MSLIGVIPQSHVLIITRFGKYSRTCSSGLYFKLPWEKEYLLIGWGSTANKEQKFIELSEQQTDTQPRQCHTKDNVAVQADASIYWRIVDPKKAVFEVDTLPQSIRDISLNALRASIGKLELDEVLSSRQRLSEEISLDLSHTTAKWGVQLTRVELQELKTSDSASHAMEKQMTAERESRAIVARAQGTAEGEVVEAEGHAKAVQIRAEGEALALAKTAEAEAFYLSKLKEVLGDKDAARILIAQKCLLGFDKISQNPAHKVYLPSSFKGILSLDSSES